MKVAVVGTGRMGSADGTRHRARRRRAGRSTTARRNGRERWPTSSARRVAGSPAEAAAGADVAITMLTDGDAVRDTWDGPDGLVAGAHDGGVLVDSSTVPPDTLAGFEAAVHERGSGILDAPVSGSTKLAEAGQLTIMAGGSAEDLERARPALELVLGRSTTSGRSARARR